MRFNVRARKKARRPFLTFVRVTAHRKRVAVCRRRLDISSHLSHTSARPSRRAPSSPPSPLVVVRPADSFCYHPFLSHTVINENIKY